MATKEKVKQFLIEHIEGVGTEGLLYLLDAVVRYEETTHDVERETRPKNGGEIIEALDEVPVPTHRSRRRRRSWKMSAPQKKAISDRMRKYWAARRKAKASKK